MVQPVGEQGTVRQTGQVVVECIVEQLVFKSFTIRDLGEGTGHAVRLAIVIKDNQAAG